MVGYIYKLPAGFTSVEDKPSYNLFQQALLIAPKTMVETLEPPSLDSVEIQTGYVDNSVLPNFVSMLGQYNYLNIPDINVWYQIEDIELISNSQYKSLKIRCKVDIYLTGVVAYFNENPTQDPTSSTGVYFKQKHLNRYGYETTDGNQVERVLPDKQFYLLSKYEELKNIGTKVDKTLIQCNPDYYVPQSLTQGVKNIGAVSNSLQPSGSTNTSGANYSVYPGSQTSSDNATAFTQGIQCVGYYPVSVNYPSFFQTNNPGGSYAYPCILGKMTPNETNILTDGVPYPFPYALGGIGGTQTLIWECYSPFANGVATGNGGTFGSAVPNTVNNGGNDWWNANGGLHNFYNTSSNGFNANTSDLSKGETSGVQAGPQWFQLVQDGGISDDYFTGVYLLPLPINYYTNLFYTPELSLTNLTPYTIYESAGNFTGRFSVAGTSVKNPTGLTDSYFDVNMNNNGYVSSVSLQPDKYYACFDPVIPLIQNQLYAGADLNNLTLPTFNDLSSIEPALLNYERINVRLYGQDNYVDPMSFTGYISGSLISSLIYYTLSFCLTVSPPNMTITNIPMNVGNNCTLYPINVGNYNTLNDAIGSTILKAEAPNVANNGNNYLATSKNAYDTALNVSQLMAQQSMTSAVFGGLGAISDFANENVMGGVGALGGTIGGIFGAIAQEDKYKYLKTGKKLDMSRTSNMRVSATSTINTLYNACYTNIIEVPPLYEQVAVVNYYALHGYKLERGLPFNYGYNRNICNGVSIAFFTNALIPFVNANGKGKIDKMMSDGIRIGNMASFLPGIDIPLNYSLVLYNDATGETNKYENSEANQNNEEIELLLGTYNANLQATKINQKNATVQTNKDSTKD